MRSILEQLESTESILLMYLADELPQADREQVQKRLADDATLRAQLEQLRAAQETMISSFQALDASQPLPSTPAATQRKLARAIRQWQTDRVVARAQNPQPISRWRRFSWAYPWVAAAVIVIGYIVWWGTQPSEQSLPSQAQQAVNDYDGIGGPDGQFGWRAPSTQDVVADSETRKLADTERDLDTLSYLRELTVTQ